MCINYSVLQLHDSLTALGGSLHSSSKSSEWIMCNMAYFLEVTEYSYVAKGCGDHPLVW